ncbi:MAG: hypothetical protein K5930_11595 [Treponemataceae bacterium]|nr:hypothetical protein [Treponemataceae bacterium]
MKLNKESIKVYLVLIACLVLGIGSFFFLPTIVALIILGVCLFAAYTVLKAVSKIMSARITTYTDGFTVRTSDGTKMEFEWDLISYAGFVVEGIQKGYIFVYEESVDRFIQLPPTFENLQGFREEVEEHHPVEDCYLKPTETIKERIKSLFVTEEEDAGDAEPAAKIEDAVDEVESAPEDVSPDEEKKAPEEKTEE